MMFKPGEAWSVTLIPEEQYLRMRRLDRPGRRLDWANCGKGGDVDAARLESVIQGTGRT